MIEYKVHVRPDDFESGIELFVSRREYGEGPAKRFFLMPDGTWVEPNQNWWPSPTAHLQRDVAQELMDRLYACGLRPAEAAGSAGSLAAVQKHLEDMRSIVFEHYLKGK